jgi:putative acetyltransferase
VLIRREASDDVEAISVVTDAAFRKPDGDDTVEARLVNELRRDQGWRPELSLVAVDNGEVVGHVVCTRAMLGGRAVLGLGPLSVRPDRQRQGVGKALMHAVLGAADALGEPVVVLLGDPRYYSRFGFRLAAEIGVTPPVASWAPHFQARTLTMYEPDLRGAFTYAEPFDRV